VIVIRLLQRINSLPLQRICGWLLLHRAWYIDGRFIDMTGNITSGWFISEGWDVLFCALALAENHRSSFILDILLFVLTMRSLRKYSREFAQLYPSCLLHVLVRDGECTFRRASRSVIDHKYIAIIFFLVSV
jgi:hypothetical protein